MSRTHTVRQGECVQSIAARYGWIGKQLWNLPENDPLRETRDNPEALAAGDIIAVPPLRLREESASGEQKHTYKRASAQVVLRLRVAVLGEARAWEPYILKVDGTLHQGTLDRDGMLEVVVPPDARRALLLVGETEDQFEIRLGQVDPLNTVSGVQGRLNSLGLACGAQDDVAGPATAAAIRRFQRSQELAQTGQMDDELRARLKVQFGA